MVAFLLFQVRSRPRVCCAVDLAEAIGVDDFDAHGSVHRDRAQLCVASVRVGSGSVCVRAPGPAERVRDARHG